MTITDKQRQIVRERARNCCEYCRLPESGGTISFHIDHVVSLKHDGSNGTENLCLACYKCNRYKGADVGGFDPATDNLTRFYHPRYQVWDDHFRIEADMQITGLTSEGRTTIRVLRMNEKIQLQNRQTLARLDMYPC